MFFPFPLLLRLSPFASKQPKDEKCFLVSYTGGSEEKL